MTEEIEMEDVVETAPTRFALIVGGFVSRIIAPPETPEDYTDPTFTIVASETAQVGQQWNGTEFVDPIIRRHAQVRDGLVVNVCNAAEGYDAGDGSEFIPSDTAQIGGSYADGVFTSPPPVHEPLPPIDAWRFEAAIELAGIKDQIDAAIDALPAEAHVVAKAKRNRVQQYHRDDPLIAALAPSLNLSSEQVDDLWRLAASL